MVLVAPLVFRAPEGPAAVCAGGRRPARSPSALRAFGSARRLEARPGPATAHRHRGRSLRRPPYRRCCVAGVWLGASARSPARPCHRPPAPRQIPPAPFTPVAPGVLMTIRIIAEPTPNSACNSPMTLSNPEIRSLELQRFLTLLKLHPIELHATFLRQAPSPPTGTAARPRHLPPVSEISRVKPLSPLLARLCVGLKPPSPLLAQAEPQLKPPSPLRAKRSCFSCIFRLQWCRRFQWSLFGGEQWCRRFHVGLHQWLQWCHWFQSWHVAVFCARKSSPCSARRGRVREKVRPASSKRPKNTVFRRVGRTFSRKCRWRGRAGRTFSRIHRWMGHAGRTFSHLLWQRSSF